MYHDAEPFVMIDKMFFFYFIELCRVNNIVYTNYLSAEFQLCCIDLIHTARWLQYNLVIMKLNQNIYCGY